MSREFALFIYLLACPFLGGIRSLARSRPLASSKPLILWFTLKPCNAKKKKKKIFKKNI